MGSADHEFVLRSKAGDKEAFAEIVSRYQTRIFNFAFRLLQQREEAQDVTQEVFLRAYRSMDRYIPDQPLAAWLYKIANNLCIDAIRRRKIRTVSLSAPQADGDELQQIDIPDQSLNPENLFNNQEIQRSINEAIASLPYRYRVVTILRHIQDLSYQEISKITGQPEGTIKAQIFRARRILREKLRSVG